MSQEVQDFVTNRQPEWQAEICQRLDELVRHVIPDVEDKIQYSKPHYRKNGKYAAVIGVAKEHVSFTIFNAQDINGPTGFFEPGPPERKTIKIRKDTHVDYDLTASLLQQASSTL